MSCGGLKTFPGIDPLNHYLRSWEFDGNELDSEGWTDSTANGGTVTLGNIAGNVEPLHPGTRDLNIDFGNVGGPSRADFRRDPEGWVLTQGAYRMQWLVKVVQEPDATDDYTARIGMADGVTITSNAVNFQIQRTVSTTNWLTVTDGAGQTLNDSGIAWVEGEWTLLEIIVNAAGTSVQYLVDNVNAGVHTLTIPANTIDLGMDIGVGDVAGAAGLTNVFSLDWALQEKNFSASRLG